MEQGDKSKDGTMLFSPVMDVFPDEIRDQIADLWDKNSQFDRIPKDKVKEIVLRSELASNDLLSRLDVSSTDEVEPLAHSASASATLILKGQYLDLCAAAQAVPDPDAPSVFQRAQDALQASLKNKLYPLVKQAMDQYEAANAKADEAVAESPDDADDAPRDDAKKEGAEKIWKA